MTDRDEGNWRAAQWRERREPVHLAVDDEPGGQYGLRFLMWLGRHWPTIILVVAAWAVGFLFGLGA